MPYNKPKVSHIMKKQLLTSILTIFFLTLDFMAFAQSFSAPGFDDENNDLEGSDQPETPINGKVLILLIVGIAFAYYTIKKNREVKPV